MNSVATPSQACVNQSIACIPSTLHFRRVHMQSSLPCLPTSPYRLTSTFSPLSCQPHFLLPTSLQTYRPCKNAPVQHYRSRCQCTNALPPFQQYNRSPHHRPHLSSSRSLNPNNQHEPNDKTPSPNTGQPSICNLPTRPDSRHMSAAAHGILALRPSAGLYTRPWLPAGERGHAAE